MARIDVPTLKCDRCDFTTQDIKEMEKFQKLRNYHMSGFDDWDLCPVCWEDFQFFMTMDFQ